MFPSRSEQGIRRIYVSIYMHLFYLNSWFNSIPNLCKTTYGNINLRSSSIYKIFQVVCPLQKYLRSSSLFHFPLLFTKSFEVSSFYKNVEVTQTKCLRSSSLHKNIWCRLPFKNIFEVVFHLQKYVRSSTIYRNIGIFWSVLKKQQFALGNIVHGCNTHLF